MDYQQDGLYKQIDSTAIHLSPYLILQILFLIYTRLVSLYAHYTPPWEMKSSLKHDCSPQEVSNLSRDMHETI